MAEIINIIFAFIIVFFVIRWIFGQNTAGYPASRFVPPEEMIQAVHNAFPHVPREAIKYDLEQTGSAEITCEKILQTGSLPMPPNVTITQSSFGASGSNSGSQNQENSTSHVTSRYTNLSKVTADSDIPDEPVKLWEGDSSKRNDMLHKRKEYILMQARKNFLEKQRTTTT